MTHTTTSTMNADEGPARFFLEHLPNQIDDLDATQLRRLGSAKAVVQFRLTGEGGGSWYVVLEGDEVRVAEGLHAGPSFTLTFGVDTYHRLRRGEENGVTAFLRGVVRVTGSKTSFLRVVRLVS